MADPTPAQLRKQLINDMAPSVRQQSMGFVQWDTMGDWLGQPFDSTRIPLHKLRQMRRDPMIAFALQFVKLPLVRAPWFIECEDARIAQFMTEALRLIYERLMLQFSLKYDYGYQAIIKNFTSEPVDWVYSDAKSSDANTKPVWSGTADPVLWKPFTSVPPEQVYPEWTKSGEFDGFTRSFTAVPGAAQRTPDKKGYVDVAHALWITNEKDSRHGSIWGYPRIGYSYRYWWSYWYGWALRDRYMERMSDPAVIVRYPNDRIIDNETGEVLNLRAVAEMLGEDIRAGCTVTLPSDVIKDADGKPSQMLEWNISYLEHSGKTPAEFQQLFDYLDIMKLRSCLVPERALIVPARSASVSGVTEQLADFFTESQATEMVEFGDIVNRYMIPQLQAVNFPEYKGKVRWISRGFSSADRTLILQLLTLVGQSDPDKLQMDVREIMAQLQVPLKTPEQLAIEKKQAQEDFANQAKAAATAATAAKPGPPPNKVAGGQMGPKNTAGKKTNLEELDAIPGVRAGINKHGLYYDPRERIVLSNDYPMGPFTHKIKDLRYYKGNDKALQSAHDIYEAWLTAFQTYYLAVAKHIRTRLVALAENSGINDNTADHLAGQTINAAEKLFTQALQDATDAMLQLAEWAAQREMKELNLDIEWETKNSDISDWMKLHGAELVRNVTESTRNELRNLIATELATDHLPEQIAQEIENKFEQWPGWKAERIARSEARDAYNAGTLLAAQKSGITHARASDASGGKNLHTDIECIERNGQIFTVQQALTIQDHPNGTLAWTPLPSDYNFSEEDNPKRLKNSLQLAQDVKWELTNGIYKANLPKAEVTSNSSSPPSITVSARLLYLTSELEDPMKINLHLESHPEGLIVSRDKEEITFYDVEDKFANGAKIPEKIFLDAILDIH